MSDKTENSILCRTGKSHPCQQWRCAAFVPPGGTELKVQSNQRILVTRLVATVFDSSEWDTGGAYRALIPHAPGHYILAGVGRGERSSPVALYVGMAKNLYKRLNGHNMLKAIEIATESSNMFFMDFFKCYDGDLRAEELRLIQTLRPPFNTAGRLD
jgi:hypothetical protein